MNDSSSSNINLKDSPTLTHLTYLECLSWAIGDTAFEHEFFHLWHFWYHSLSFQVSYTKFRVDPILFPERNKRSSNQMYKIFSSYVLILNIHMKPQVSLNVSHQRDNVSIWMKKKKKRKKLFLFKKLRFKIKVKKFFGKLPIISFVWKGRKEKRVKTFSCIKLEMMKVFGKLLIISFVWKRKKRQKEEKHFLVLHSKWWRSLGDSQWFILHEKERKKRGKEPQKRRKYEAAKA